MTKCTIPWNKEFDKARKNILCTIEDFYNFNPDRTKKVELGINYKNKGT